MNFFYTFAKTHRTGGGSLNLSITLMQRTGDNPELVNALRDFVTVLENRATFPNNFEPMSPSRQTNLTAFFQEIAERLGGNIEVPIPDRR